MCVGNIVSFSVGTAITWASPEIDKLKNSTLAITEEEASWVTSLFHLGAAFGPFLFGYLADKIGRKLTLVSLGFPFAIIYLLMAFVKNLYLFYIGRFIQGLATGGVFTVMPMYVGEIADSSNRGLLAGLLNIFLCVGMLFSYCVGPYVSILAFNLILAVFPIAFIPIFFILAVETPYYCLSKNEPLKARQILQKVRGPTANIDEEIQSIEQALKSEGQAGIADLFQIKGNRRAFIISVGLMAFQQLSGISVVLSYAQPIFKQAGTSLAPEVCSMLVGLVQLISSFLSSALSDRLGRKILLIVSSIGMVLSEGPLGVYSYLKDETSIDVSGVSFLPILLLMIYILTYNVGSGSLPWTIMGELYPSNVKSIGSSLTSGSCWLMAFIVVKYFSSISESIGLGACFMIFSICCLASIPFIQFLVIETKAKTLEQIQEELNK